MYIHLLIRYHCNVALPVLHFVNFDNFLTFPNRKILHVKHSSGWNFKRLQTHVTLTASVTSKTVQTNANTLSKVSTLRCQSGRLGAGGGNQPECWNSKTSCSFAGEETQTVSEPQCTLSASLYRFTPITWNSHNMRLTSCELRNLQARRRSKHSPCFLCLDEGRKYCGNLRCAHLVNWTISHIWVSGFEE